MHNNITSAASINNNAANPSVDIVAVATPPGRGGVSILRLSGVNVARNYAALIGDLPPPRLATLRDFKDAHGEIIDRGLVIFFPAPNSYSGEDVLELHAHGSPVVMDILLRRCVELGARTAAPGEFSERAFLNGRMDLAQAEAVADLIVSTSEAAARAAMNSLSGEFSNRINELISMLTELRVLVEADMDFGEEIVDENTAATAARFNKKVGDGLRDLQTKFSALQKSASQGKLIRDGLRVVLTGPPNAGKSSLLNALARQPRAIVSATPGTTRDVIDQTIGLDGLAVEIIDTAGLRDAHDDIEAEGIRRAQAAQRNADLILVVVEDTSEINSANELLKTRAPVCLVRNKIDLSGRPPGAIDENTVAVSALSGAGLDVLQSRIKELAGARSADATTFTARARHLDALAYAQKNLTAALKFHIAANPELVAAELLSCQNALGEITGKIHNDDLLGLIFAQFCIGK